MIIVITGTPGVGKTEVAKLLANKLDAVLISLTDLMKKKRVNSYYDRKRNTRIVSVHDVKAAIKKAIIRGKINIVEGHISHYIKADIVVILRCSPEVLESRMKAKKWGDKKIKENIQAEVLDLITAEVIKMHPKNRIIEIDTSKKTPERVVRIVLKALNSHSFRKRYLPGKTDWISCYSKYLISHGIV